DIAWSAHGDRGIHTRALIDSQARGVQLAAECGALAEASPTSCDDAPFDGPGDDDVTRLDPRPRRTCRVDVHLSGGGDLALHAAFDVHVTFNGERAHQRVPRPQDHAVARLVCHRGRCTTTSAPGRRCPDVARIHCGSFATAGRTEVSDIVRVGRGLPVGRPFYKSGNSRRL